VTVLSFIIQISSRFVDRDMVMRYHWSLGIGHTYSHGNTSEPPPVVEEGAEESMDCEGAEQNVLQTGNLVVEQGAEKLVDCDGAEQNDPLTRALSGPEAELHEPDSDDPEYGLEDRENEDLGSDDDWQDYDDGFNDDEFLSMHEMYGHW
jgi:hypothetical protein